MTSIVTKRFSDAVVRISSYDVEGMPLITDSNPIAETVTGYNTDELKMMALPDLISGITADLLREEFTCSTGVNDLVDIFRRYPQAAIKRKDGSEAYVEFKAFIIPGIGQTHDGAQLYGVYEIIIRDKSLSSRLSECVQTYEGGRAHKARCNVTGLPSGEFAGACINTYAAYAHEHPDAPFSFATMCVDFASHPTSIGWNFDKEDRVNLNALASRGIRAGLRADDVITSLDRRFLQTCHTPELHLPKKGAFFFGIGLPYCTLFQAHKSLERLRENLISLPVIQSIAQTAGVDPEIHIGCVTLNAAAQEHATSVLHRSLEVLYAARSFGTGRTAISAQQSDVADFLEQQADVTPDVTHLSARIH